MKKCTWCFWDRELLVKSNSEIVENIFSYQLIKYQKEVWGIRKRTWDAKAHDLRRTISSERDGLIGTKGTGNGKSRHRTPSILDRYHGDWTFFQRGDLNTSQLGRHEKPIKTLEAPMVQRLLYSMKDALNLIKKHWNSSKNEQKTYFSKRQVGQNQEIFCSVFIN